MRKIFNRLLPSRQGVPISYVWLALPLAISFIALNFTPLKEGDLWWHLKIGEQIFALGHIPTVDDFTLTAQGQAYTFSHSWLSDVLFYAFDKAGGLGALVLMQAIVGLLTVILLLQESLRRGAPPALAASLALLGWIGLYPFSSTRPQIFSFLILAALYVVLSGYLQSPHQPRHHLWLMPILMALWVNLHGGWPVGLMLLTIEIAVLTFTRLLWGQPGLTKQPHPATGQPCPATGQPCPALKPLLGWSFLTWAATLLNPRGIMLYAHVLTVNENPVIQQFISEWQPLVITNVLSWSLLAMLALWVLGLAYQRKDIALRDVAIMFFLTVMSLRYMRMVPYFFAAAVPITAATVAGIDWQAIFKRFERFLASDTQTNSSRAGLINWLFLFILILGTIISLPALQQILFHKEESGFISPYFPVAAVQTLRQNAPSETRVYNLAEWGGYLIWQLHPTARVFADGRAELLTPEMWDDYITLSSGAEGWEKLLDQYQINYLALSKDRQAGLILNAYQNGWGCLVEDSVAIVLSRQPADGSCPSLEKRNTP